MSVAKKAAATPSLSKEVLDSFAVLAKHTVVYAEKHGWVDNLGPDRDLGIHISFRGCPGFLDPLLILLYTGKEARLESITLINDPDEGFDEMGEEQGKKFCRMIEKLWKISPSAFVASIINSLQNAYADQEDCVCVNIHLDDFLEDELSPAVRERLSKERAHAKRARADYEQRYLE